MRMDRERNSVFAHAELKSEISNLKSNRLLMAFAWSAVICVPASLLLGAGGCQTPSHAQAKVGAEQRWSQVRGQVKLQLARQQFERRLFEDAIDTLREATALDPTSAESLALLAKANLELGKIAAAQQALLAAAQRNLESAELHYLQGVILDQRNELSAALVEYEKARSLDPSNLMYLVAHAETLVALDRPKQALALVDSMAGQFPDDSTLAVLSARIAALLGDTEDALRRLKASSQLGDSRLAGEELGRLLARQGYCTEAISVLEPLWKETGPADLSANSRRTLAGCYMEKGSPGLALMVLAEDHAEPSEDASNILRAKAALLAGEQLSALTALNEASRTTRHGAEIRLLQAVAHWKRGNLPEAESILENILAANPGDTDAWCLLGEVFLSAGQAARSEDAFQKALELDPQNHWAQAQLRPTDPPVKKN